jgi:hypothetical protein
MEKTIELDNERLVLTVTTLHYDKFEFNITTGEIRSATAFQVLLP